MSAVVASAVIATQAIMPVSAAGGSISADVTTKSPILRVQVPTKMAVAINEFEMGDEGSQITSAAFEMKNLSEIPVNVKVESEATVGASVALASTKAALEDAETDTIWLAAVAAVKNNAGTLEYADGADTTVAGLAGTEGNITTFGEKDASDKSKAVQNFYLQAATNSTYKGITDAEVTAEKTAATATIGGADFYEMTLLTNTSDDATGAAALAANQDIYIGPAPAAGSPATLTKVAKGTGSSSITWTSGTTKAYKLADTATKAADMVATNFYLYIDGAATAAGDAAAFRYVGALSETKSGWSTTDLSAVTIKYDIVGISTSAYADLAADDGLVYGYKAESAAAEEPGEESRISVSATGLMSMSGVNATNWKGGIVVLNGKEYAIGSASGSWKDVDSDPATFQFADAWVSSIKGKEITVKVTLKDDTVIEETLTVPES